MMLSRSLIIAKFLSFDAMGSSALTVSAVARETSSHVDLCKSFDVTFEEIVNTPVSPVTMAYGAYLLDVGLRVSILQCYISVAH